MRSLSIQPEQGFASAPPEEEHHRPLSVMLERRVPDVTDEVHVPFSYTQLRSKTSIHMPMSQAEPQRMISLMSPRQGDFRGAQHQLQYPSSHGEPISRYGRAGAPWRHVKRTTGYEGNNVMFVDGVVKQEDTLINPPWDRETVKREHCIPMSRHMSMISPRLSMRRSGQQQKRGHSTVWQQHAKNNFRYWHQDYKPKYSRAPINAWNVI